MSLYDWNERRLNPCHRKVRDVPESYELVDFTVWDAVSVDGDDERTEVVFNPLDFE